MIGIKSVFAGFSVDDMAKAKEFYVQTLGFEQGSDAMGLELRLPGGGSVFIYEKDNHQPATYTMLNLVVEDIDAAVDDLTSKDITFERYPELPFEQDEKGIARAQSPEDGPTIAWFKDPAGNTLSVLQQ